MTKDDHNALFNYIGTCIDIDYSGDHYGFDPTQFAYAEQRAKEEGYYMSSAVFWKLIAYVPTNIKNKLLFNSRVEYGYDNYLGILWAYNPDLDIHYLFQ